MEAEKKPGSGELGGLYGANPELQKIVERMWVSLGSMPRGSTLPTGASKEPEPQLKPEIAGGDDAKPKPKRGGRRGKVLTVGGVRSVRYYYWTIHELRMLGARRGSAMRSFAIAAFCGGLVTDGVKDAILNPPPNGTAKGVWATLLVVAALIGIYNLATGIMRARKAEKFQEDVINEHDFEP